MMIVHSTLRMRRCGGEIAQLILEREHQRIAGLQAQSRGLRIIPEQVAIARRAIAFAMVSDRQSQFQYAAPAAQVLGLRNLAANRRPRARIRLARGCGEADVRTDDTGDHTDPCQAQGSAAHPASISTER